MILEEVQDRGYNRATERSREEVGRSHKEDMEKDTELQEEEHILEEVVRSQEARMIDVGGSPRILGAYVLRTYLLGAVDDTHVGFLRGKMAWF